jgi:hypothetical protein
VLSLLVLLGLVVSLKGGISGMEGTQASFDTICQFRKQGLKTMDKGYHQARFWWLLYLRHFLKHRVGSTGDPSWWLPRY